ncbi:hypothetical protein KA344_12680 [bacterium]|jgi:hypothetical protein|nr:hypothetical protein [bacterium]
MVENSDKSSKPVANDQILNFAPEDNSKLASAALSNEAMTALKRLDAEIRDHKKQENEQSYLGSAFDFLYRKDEKSLKALEAMKLTAEDALKKGDLATVEGMTKNVNKQIEEDLRVRGWQKDINFYGSTGVKVGAVMFGGPIGWAATGALYMADEARPADSAKEQLVDAGFGLVKGLAFKGLVGGVVGSNLNLGLKGAAMSLGGRGIDTLATSRNYYDQAGNFSPLDGLGHAAANSFTPTNLAMDAAAMGIGYGIGKGVSKAFGPVLERSAFWTRIASSGVYGASSGAVAEVSMARATGEAVSLRRVGTRAAASGLLYSLASVPGALQADVMDYREYRKLGTVNAEKLDQPIEWKTGNGDPMRGEAGDWMVSDASGSKWTVKPDIFAKTYGEVPGCLGQYQKTALGVARRLTFPTTIETLEGKGSGNAGDYMMRGPAGESYIVSKSKFESIYVPK